MGGERNPKRQCRGCPWRKGASTDKIPNYSREKHLGLRETIAEPGSLRRVGDKLQFMACHDSPDAAPTVCVGWAVQQLGVGNNIALRIAAMRDPRFHGLETDGPQREEFEETLEGGDDDEYVG